MDNKNIIETFGTISKKEILASIEEEFCNGAFILESKFPFPGYYHNIIPDKKVLNPGSVFILTKKTHTEEDIMRVSQEVKKEFNKPFNAAMGEVVVFNETSPCIRVKSLEDYHYLPQLINHYRSHGIQTLKYRTVKSYYDLIKIRKYFVLENPEPGFYRDAEEHQMCYIEIPGYFTWDQFEKTTLDLKRNIEDNKFDAAIGTLYHRNQLVDMVRIYAENMTMERLKFLRDKYVEAVTRLKK